MTSNDSMVTRRKKVFFGRSLDDDLFRTIYEMIAVGGECLVGGASHTENIGKRGKTQHKKCGCNPVMGQKLRE